MKEIKLTKGYVALVDDEDYEFINQDKWCFSDSSVKFRSTGYAIRGIWNPGLWKTRMIYMHHVILNVTDRQIKIDHKDGNGLNNQKENLRTANKSQNGRNRKKIRHQNNRPCSSQYKGVYWNADANKWQAYYCTNGKNQYLGVFDLETDAAKAYNEAAIRYYGEFAKLNEV